MVDALLKGITFNQKVVQSYWSKHSKLVASVAVYTDCTSVV
jgi:hypothetical protein